MALSLSMTRDKTGVWFISVTAFDGGELNISGATLWFHAAVGGIAIDKSSPSDGITVTNAMLGQATLQIDPVDTETIPQSGDYSGPCELTLESGADAFQLNSGTLTVLPNVGTP